jgi:hypothetical protein
VASTKARVSGLRWLEILVRLDAKTGRWFANVSPRLSDYEYRHQNWDAAAFRMFDNGRAVQLGRDYPDKETAMRQAAHWVMCSPEGAEFAMAASIQRPAPR